MPRRKKTTTPPQTEVTEPVTESVQRFLDQFIAESGNAEEILIDVARRKHNGRLHRLDCIGIPPPELSISEFLVGLFGPGLYHVRVRIKGVTKMGSVRTGELDLRDHPPVELPAEYWEEDEAKDVKEGSPKSEAVGLPDLIREMREEQQLSRDRYELERLRRDERQHELMIALMSGGRAGGVAAAPAADDDKSKIMKLLEDTVYKRAVAQVVGGGGGSVGADGLPDLFSMEGGLGNLVNPMLRGAGAELVARFMGEEEEEDEEGTQQEEQNEEGTDVDTSNVRELSDKQLVQEVKRRRARDRARAKRKKERAEKAARKQANRVSEPRVRVRRRARKRADRRAKANGANGETQAAKPETPATPATPAPSSADAQA